MRIDDLYGVPLSIVRVRTRLVTRAKQGRELANDFALGRLGPVQPMLVSLGGGGVALRNRARMPRTWGVCQDRKLSLWDQRDEIRKSDAAKENYARKASLLEKRGG